MRINLNTLEEDNKRFIQSSAFSFMLEEERTRILKRIQAIRNSKTNKAGKDIYSLNPTSLNYNLMEMRNLEELYNNINSLYGKPKTSLLCDHERLKEV